MQYRQQGEGVELIGRNVRHGYNNIDPETAGDGNHEDGQADGGEYIKAMMFGGLDGILTSFAIVAGAAGGKLSSRAILILGFSNILADALSMGVGEYLSSKAHNEYVMSEKKQAVFAFQNRLEEEVNGLISKYTQRQMSLEDATLVVKTMSKYEQFFVEAVMTEELGLQVPDANEDETLKEGFVMFLSFALFGSIPLLGYIICPAFSNSHDEFFLFVLACGVTLLSLFLMGAVKSYFGSKNCFWSGLEMLLLGGCCAIVAYEIGSLVGEFVF